MLKTSIHLYVVLPSLHPGQTRQMSHLGLKSFVFNPWFRVRVSMHGRNQDAVAVLRVQGPVSGLAVDWIHHLLYWTSVGSGSVHVGLLDGSAQRRLVAGLEEPSAVAVDPLHRCDDAAPVTVKATRGFRL